MMPPEVAEDGSPCADLNWGRVSNARLILATAPRERMFLTCRRNSGSRKVGSIRRRKVLLMSAHEIMALPEISSPFSSTTPTAVPFLTIICLTPVPVRIFAPIFQRPSRLRAGDYRCRHAQNRTSGRAHSILQADDREIQKRFLEHEGQQTNRECRWRLEMP